jgi:5-methylcytosine-specific restriction endonuclease McrA
LDVLRDPSRFEDEVYRRDGYRCRYCGTRILVAGLLKAFAAKLNSVAFIKSGGRTQDTQGIFHAFSPVADHVVPHALVGRTDPSNLVTSCPSCNSGKDSFTVEQLGIANPFSRPPVVDDWDGLSSLWTRL